MAVLVKRKYDSQDLPSLDAQFPLIVKWQMFRNQANNSMLFHGCDMYMSVVCKKYFIQGLLPSILALLQVRWQGVKRKTI